MFDSPFDFFALLIAVVAFILRARHSIRPTCCAPGWTRLKRPDCRRGPALRR